MIKRSIILRNLLSYRVPHSSRVLYGYFSCCHSDSDYPLSFGLAPHQLRKFYMLANQRFFTPLSQPRNLSYQTTSQPWSVWGITRHLLSSCLSLVCLYFICSLLIFWYDRRDCVTLCWTFCEPLIPQIEYRKPTTGGKHSATYENYTT